MKKEISDEAVSDEAVEEMKYNALPGVGTSKVPYRLTALTKLCSLDIEKRLKEELEEYLRICHRCNGAYVNDTIKPGTVKSREL